MQTHNYPKQPPSRLERIIKKVNNEILFSVEELCFQQNYDKAVSKINSGLNIL
jgi:hypothetical protein